MPRWVKATLVGVSISLIGIGLALTPLGARFEEEVGLTWLFKMRKATEPPNDVVVLAIDGRTGNRLDLPKLPGDWPRSIHGRVVDRLVELGASVIVFDMDFRRAKAEDKDKVLAAAIQRANRVVLVESLEGLKQPLSDVASWTKSVQVTEPDAITPDNENPEQTEGWLWVEQLIPPAEVLAKAAYGMGTFPVPKTQEAVYQYWAFKPSAGDAPTIPAVALQVHAMAAYEDWRQILEEAGIRSTAHLPRLSQDIQSAAELREMMVKLRRSVQNDPNTKERLMRVIEQLDVGDDKAKLIRALHVLYSDGDHRYLNFYGPPGTVTTIPYHLAAGEEWESLDVRGKAVFVGFSDLYNPGQPDRFYTVFTNEDGIDLSGVEIAATAFGNLINREAVSSTDTTTTILILFLFGAVLGAGIYLFQAIIAVPIALGIAASYGIGAQYAFDNGNLWLPLATPLLVQLPMAVFIGLSSNYLLERRKKQEVTEAIAYYLPEDVVADLGRGSFNPGSVNKVVYAACLATDMAGFSTIAETMPPEMLAIFVNRYFDALAAPLKKHNVGVTEFRADAVMCAWTAPQPEEGIRRSAVLAALDTRDAILQFSSRVEIPLSARVGLAADFVHIGHAGGGGHFVYSIVGDAANTASRIEGLNKHLNTELLATEAMTAGIEGLLLRPVGEFQLKGKKEGTRVVELVAEGSSATDEQRRLCDRFAEALSAFRDQRWGEAASLFQATLEQFANDGPSLFYLDYCKQYMQHPPDSDSPTMIHMEFK